MWMKSNWRTVAAFRNQSWSLDPWWWDIQKFEQETKKTANSGVFTTTLKIIIIVQDGWLSMIKVSILIVRLKLLHWLLTVQKTLIWRYFIFMSKNTIDIRSPKQLTSAQSRWGSMFSGKEVLGDWGVGSCGGSSLSGVAQPAHHHFHHYLVITNTICKTGQF